MIIQIKYIFIFSFFSFLRPDMLASNLPYEILLKIGKHLSIAQSIQCALVCKAWTLPFQEVFWKSISINSTQELRNICKLAMAPKSNIEFNGHIVHELSVRSRLEISHQQLSILQNCFQNLNYLHLDCNTIPKGLITNKIHWQLWETLEVLSVRQPKTFISNGAHGFASLLAFYPRLKQLIIDECLWIKMSAYTWKDFEIILQPLQQLRTLDIDINYGYPATDTMELSNSISPIDSLVNLCVNTCNADNQWLYYFAKKAPKIHTLVLNIDSSDKTTSSQWTTMTEMLKGMSSPFEHLRTLHLKECSIERYFGPFMDLFHRLDVPLTTLVCSMKRNFITAEVIQTIIEKNSRLFSKTMRNMELTGRRFAAFECSKPICLSLYPCLVKLELRQLKTCIVLDNILNQCPVLDTLILDQPCVTVRSGHESSPPSLHRLKNIFLANSKVDSGLFDYLSLCCQRLSVMKLESVKVFGHTIKGAKYFQCDMSHTQIDSLFLYNVQYYALHNKSASKCNDHPTLHNAYQVKDAIMVNRIDIEQNIPGLENDGPAIKSMCFLESLTLYTNSNMAPGRRKGSPGKTGLAQSYMVWKFDNLKSHVVHGFERESEN
ncbi:hypothetical protein CLU79DRAFT_848326 [Phycomyces nitens]|nr:hypothetical protein CLU79DRAFT_848326 [Phycomyces nitens]